MIKAVILSLLGFLFIEEPALEFSSDSCNSCPTVYDQLVKLNKYWQYNEVNTPILQEHICFEKSIDLIQLHLQLVERHLRGKGVERLSATQKANRLQGLDILKQYWQRQAFPINNHHPGKVVPYFIDDFGTACAVGHLMRETGFTNIAKKVRQEMNYAFIEDMNYPELLTWAGQYGFEEMELRWIQPSYNFDCPTLIGNYNEGFSFFSTDISITDQGFCWYTFTGSTSEEAFVEEVSNGGKYLAIRSNTASDIVLDLGNHDSGNYTLDFNLWAFEGDKAYFNILHQFESTGANNEWAAEVYFNGTGNGVLHVGGSEYPFTYLEASWNDVNLSFDLDGSVANLQVNGVPVHSWPFTYQPNQAGGGLNQLAGLNFYRVDNTYNFFIDNISFQGSSNHPNDACACTSYTSGNICENFDSYASGQYLSDQSPCWTPWNGINGSSTDGLVNGTEGYDFSSALEINNEDDVVLYLGDRSSGRYNLSFKIKRKEDRAAHYNLRHQFVANSSQADDLNGYAVFLLPNDEGHYFYQGAYHQFTYDSEGWIYVDNVIDLDNDLITLYINGSGIASWPYSYDLNNTTNNPVILDAVNFWSYDSQNYTYEFFVDDVLLTNLNLPDCTGDPLFYPWIQEIVSATDCPPCTGIIQAEWEGNAIFIHYWDAYSCGMTDSGGSEIYDCEGNLLQSCFTTIAGSTCNLYAGIDSWTNEQILWECPNNECIDLTIINPGIDCTSFYEPVCGCDSETYQNACIAQQSGVTSWTEGACGSVSTQCAATTLISCNGSLEDGSGNNNYGNNLSCSWLIKPIGALAVTLSFYSFDTENEEDYLNVYDGDDANAILLGSFSGNSLPPNLTANSGSMYIEFITSGAITRQGWNANYFCEQGTVGDCATPINPQTVEAGHSYLQIKWDDSANMDCFTFSNSDPFNGYEVRYREQGGSWNNIITTSAGATNFYNYYGGGCIACPVIFVIYPPFAEAYLNQLKPCTAYEFQIRTVSVENQTTILNATAWSSVYTESTTECNNPYFSASCYSVPTLKPCAQIDALIVDGDFFSVDSNLGDCTYEHGDFGYDFYDNTIINLNVNNTHDIEYYVANSPSLNEIGNPVDFRVKAWIDYNQDNDYDDAGELLFNATNTTNLNVSTVYQNSFTVPTSAVEGNTRMRLLFLTEDDQGNIENPEPCDLYRAGHTREFNVNIYDNSNSCTITSYDLLCLPWVQQYINTNYNCEPGQCGGISLYTAPNGACVIDFEQEISCLLTVCPPHEVFDLDGNLVASYSSECGLEGLGYTDFSLIWDCTQPLPDCDPNAGNTYTLYPELPQTIPCTGETFCVPFTVENFTDFTGSMVSLSWGVDVLWYESVGNFNPEITGLDISDFNFSQVENGILTLDWETIPCSQAQAGDGITLDDCGGTCKPVFFEICFITIAGEGQSTSFEMLSDSYAHREVIGCVDLPIGVQPNTIETCGDGLTSCSTDIAALKCLDWLNNIIQNIDCSADCPDYVERYTYQGSHVISIYTGGGCFPLLDLPRFDIYACDGTFLFQVNESIPSAFSDPVLIWDCSQTLPNCSDTPWPIPDCTAGLNVHFINTVWEDFSSDIDGTSLEAGDWIGLFYQDEAGQFICSDAVQISDPADDFSLQACGDNLFTLEKDGFATGEVFRYKVLKNGQEYEPSDLFPEYHELGHFSPSFPNAAEIFEGNLRISSLMTLNTQIWPPIPPDCENATPLNCGDLYTNHTNSAGLRNAEWYNCSDNVLDGPEIVYEFVNTSQQDVKVTMSNLVNDLELYLFDECDQYNCMSKSERSGTSDEVILVEDLPEGTYYIVVEGYYGYESTYNITLECGDFPQGEFTCAPTPIGCGSSIPGTTNGACSEVDFYACGEAYVSGPEMVYSFSVNTLSQITATLNILGGADLDLFLLDDLNPNSCIAYSNQGGTIIEQLLMDVAPGRTYYLVVEGFNGAQGPFELGLNCSPYIPCTNPPCITIPDVDCDALPEITCNEEIEGDNATGSSNVDTWGSCSGAVTGREVIYKFTNPVDQYVKIELWDFDENLNVYVLDGCPSGGCVMSGDKDGLIPEAIQKPVLPAGNYIIAIDGFAGAQSMFKLKVTCENTFVPCLEIPIVTGENYISSNRVPVDLNFKQILLGTEDFVDVVINEHSADVYSNMPGSPPNGNEWDITDAYKVLASGDGIIKICGEAADSTLAIEVLGLDNNGIPFHNYIPYLFQESHLISEAFTETDGLGALFYLSPYGMISPYFFPIEGPDDFLMEGGRGYLLQVDADGTFSYRNNIQAYIPNGCVHFQTPLRQTYHHSAIKMEQQIIDQWLEPGDEIGFFTQDGILCGSAHYNGFDLVSVLQADQLGTPEQEGFPEASPITAKIWRRTSGKVLSAGLEFKERSSLFAKGTIYELGNLSLATNEVQGLAEEQKWMLYPNPANQFAFVELALTNAETVSVEVFSIDGRQQLVLTPQVFSAGYHTLSLDLKNLPNGSYLVRLVTKTNASVKKMVLENQQ